MMDVAFRANIGPANWYRLPSGRVPHRFLDYFPFLRLFGDKAFCGKISDGIIGIHRLRLKDKLNLYDFRKIIMAEFSQYKGLRTLRWESQLDAYIRQAASIRIGTRQNSLLSLDFPSKVAFAITIHKCQGLTMARAILSFVSKDFSPGLSYMALSRVKRLRSQTTRSFDVSYTLWFCELHDTG